MNRTRSASRTLRLIALGAILGLGSYWAGSRWGTRLPDRVEAVPPAPAPASPPNTTGMSEDEAINVRVYSAAAPAVANIVTRTMEYDEFMEPVPAEPPGIEPGPKGCSLSAQSFSRKMPSVCVVLRLGFTMNVLVMDATCAPESRCSSNPGTLE